jgi:hypothetical protein
MQDDIQFPTVVLYAERGNPFNAVSSIPAKGIGGIDGRTGGLSVNAGKGQ